MEQGLVSRSAVEYALMRKYTLALMLNVLGVFLVASSYWALAKDLAESPMKVIQLLAVELTVRFRKSSPRYCKAPMPAISSFHM